jgi:hypothetical protein
MLTNLNFLNSGEIFPPKCESDRMKKYEDNKLLFKTRQDKVYYEQFKRIERVINNFGEVVSYPVIINYQKLITLKIIDMLLGESPKIKAPKQKESPVNLEQITIDSIIEKSDLYNTAYMVGIDVSRFGDGLFYIYQDIDGGKIGFTQPSYWYPVVNPENTSDILYHVIAYTVCVSDDNYRLICQIHSKGSYEQREYKLIQTLQGKEIGNLVDSKIIQTGLSDFAIIQVSNLRTTDCICGYDDYTDIDSIVSEILVRIAQISKILDKHASPSVSGPSGCLEQDHITGEWKLKMGSYFPKDSKDDPTVEYITWNGQLDSAFKQLEFLINTLYIMSETGATLLGETDKAGQASSGTALKLKMMSPQTKVKRIRMRFDPALKKAMRLCSQLGGESISDLTNIPISITWQDGIPNDDTELANIMNIRTGGKATISQKRAIQVLDDLSDEQVEEELEEIQDEEATQNPLSIPPFSGDNNKLPTEDEMEEN